MNLNDELEKIIYNLFRKKTLLFILLINKSSKE